MAFFHAPNPHARPLSLRILPRSHVATALPTSLDLTGSRLAGALGPQRLKPALLSCLLHPPSSRHMMHALTSCLGRVCPCFGFRNPGQQGYDTISSTTTYQSTAAMPVSSNLQLPTSNKGGGGAAIAASSSDSTATPVHPAISLPRYVTDEEVEVRLWSSLLLSSFPLSLSSFPFFSSVGLIVLAVSIPSRAYPFPSH